MLVGKDFVQAEIQGVPTSQKIVCIGVITIQWCTTHIVTFTPLSNAVPSIPTIVTRSTDHGAGINNTLTENPNNSLHFSKFYPKIHLLLTDQNYSNMVLTNEVYHMLVLAIKIFFTASLFPPGKIPFLTGWTF